MPSTTGERSMTARLAGVWERQWEEDPLGCAESEIDCTTLVVWTQTPCGMYVDLRLPAGAPGRQPSKDRMKRPQALCATGQDIGDYTDQDTTIKSILLEQKSFAGWLECSLGDTTSGEALEKDKVLADLVKANAGPLPLCTCFWKREIDYQPPTGGLDIGVCATSPQNADGSVDMRETGDDASYAEGWHRVPGTSDGPFVALELISENGKPRTGYWVRAGNRFAYAVGRPAESDSISSVIKECTGKPLADAIDSLLMYNTDEETIAVAMSYVAVIGEVHHSGSWSIDASTSAHLVGCVLVGSDTQQPFCCSTLSLASGESRSAIGKDTLLKQRIPVGGSSGVTRTWKVVEMSSPDALTPTTSNDI